MEGVQSPIVPTSAPSAAEGVPVIQAPQPAPAQASGLTSATQTQSTTPPAPSQSKKSSKKILFLVIVIIAIVLIVGGALIWFLNAQVSKKPEKQLATYFSYTDEEKKSITSQNSKYEITKEEVFNSTEKVFELIIINKMGDVESSRVLAYITTAQKDAAYLSYNEKGKFAGSLEPVSKEILCLFFIADCSDIEVENSDEYSKYLATIVVKRVKDRIEEDKAMTKPYASKSGELYWNGPEPRVGIDAGSRKPWVLTNGDQFRVKAPPEPDSPIWIEQLAEVKKQLSAITNEQRESVIYWAGGPGTKTPPGIWLSITEEYIVDTKPDLDLEKLLLIRSHLSLAMADAVIAVFDSKWTYWIRRPFMLDKTILTVMPTPNHASYPAGHSTISGAAATILSYYFPERKEKWEELKITAGSGRTWGGIHFPIDNEAGFTLGAKVANEVLK